MPRTKAFAVNAGSAEINAMVARAAPSILELLGDGVPRRKPAIVAALAGRHDKQDVVHALIRLAVYRPDGGHGRQVHAGAAGHRRHDRAPPRQAHRREGHLPRPGALLEEAPRQGQRPAPAQPAAPGPDPLGGACLGLAVPDRAGSFGTLLPRARPAAQEADRLGAADGPASTPLAARARGRAAWAAAGSPPWNSWRRSPGTGWSASPACGSTRPCTSRPRRGGPGRAGARGPTGPG